MYERTLTYIQQSLTGVGFAMALVLLAHAMADLAAVSWCARAMYLLFSSRPDKADQQEEFFYKQVLGFKPDTEGVRKGYENNNTLRLDLNALYF